MSPSRLGSFWGIGVGPGPAGYIALAAVDALKQADLILAPRARGAKASVALQCLEGIEISSGRVREFEFDTDLDRAMPPGRYAELAGSIAAELSAGRSVAYLTIGDPLTYSTYGYVLAALRERVPALACHTFPGITSFAAAASAMGWPLAEGKDRVLILPCPDDVLALRRDIESHDVVVLMKIGARLPWVVDLLREMGIAEHCAFAGRLGLPGEVLRADLRDLETGNNTGYLATLLIRRTARERRFQ